MNAPEKTFKSMATWQTPPSKITNPQFPVTALNNLVLRVPPVVLKPTKEPAVFGLNWVSATGTGHSVRGAHLRPGHGTEYPEDLRHLWSHPYEGAILAADHRGDDGDWHS